MRKITILLAGAALVGAGIFWSITRPAVLPADYLSGLTGDVMRGETVFWAAGCASCHAADKAEGAARLVLSGGRAFPSPFGTFRAPNISNDPNQGIGSWSALDLANAMQRGVSPDGSHYFPAFPYTSYSRATGQDIVDLRQFMATLPSDPTPNMAHEVGFPFNIRRSLGGWKFLFLRDNWQVSGDLAEVEQRGRYLVEALGHCGECHTPRNMLGGLQSGQWLAGAADPSGKGRIPNITPARLKWSASDLVEYFTSGFTPDYDVVGGHMADVVQNLAQLPREDRAAIAAYLARVTPIE
jgi:mono/diheme cytochrome c family protein